MRVVGRKVSARAFPSRECFEEKKTEEISNKDKKEEGKGRERWERWQEKGERFSKKFDGEG